MGMPRRCAEFTVLMRMNLPSASSTYGLSGWRPAKAGTTSVSCCLKLELVLYQMVMFPITHAADVRLWNPAACQAREACASLSMSEHDESTRKNVVAAQVLHHTIHDVGAAHEATRTGRALESHLLHATDLEYLQQNSSSQDCKKESNLSNLCLSFELQSQCKRSHSSINFYKIEHNGVQTVILFLVWINPRWMSLGRYSFDSLLYLVISW